MKKLFMFLVRGYQKIISPLFPPTCRYYPTCSHYTLGALEKHGALKGSVMGLSRIIRCNPFVEGGIDPVPDHFTLKRQYPKDEKYREESEWNNVDVLLDKYKEAIHIQHAPLQDVISDFAEVHPLSLNTLHDDYIERISEEVKVLGKENPEFMILEIMSMKDSEYELKPPFDTPLNQAAGDLDKQYILVEKDIGVIKASQTELAVDLVLSYGVTDVDINEQSSRLHHYLTTLERMEV